MGLIGNLKKENQLLKLQGPERSELFDQVGRQTNRALQTARENATPEAQWNKDQSLLNQNVAPVAPKIMEQAGAFDRGLGGESAAFSEALNKRVGQAYDKDLNALRRGRMAMGGAQTFDDLAKLQNVNMAQMGALQQYRQQLADHNKYRAEQKNKIVGMIGGFMGQWLGAGFRQDQSPSNKPQKTSGQPKANDHGTEYAWNYQGPENENVS